MNTIRQIHVRIPDHTGQQERHHVKQPREVFALEQIFRLLPLAGGFASGVYGAAYKVIERLASKYAAQGGVRIVLQTTGDLLTDAIVGTSQQDKSFGTLGAALHGDGTGVVFMENGDVHKFAPGFLGVVPPGVPPSGDRARPGDAIPHGVAAHEREQAGDRHAPGDREHEGRGCPRPGRQVDATRRVTAGLAQASAEDRQTRAWQVGRPVDENAVDDAVRATHSAFDLDADEVEAVVYGGTGR